ncbi:MAG TPA: hypothetical protein PKI11_02750 [Candidatus Hydrogenedentes bacterium]|nr:hypothetical protein [Candidatus Hydrogenedentota bacterium]
MASEPEQELIETQRALEGRWGVKPPLVTDEALNRRLLLEALAERIRYLFEHDYNRLLTGLYLLDVNESQYQAALARPDLDAKAFALAEMILERETRRVLTWLKYASKRAADAAPPMLEEHDDR